MRMEVIEMGTLSDFVMAKQIKELSGEERIKVIREQNKRMMEKVREKLRKQEQEKELEQIKQEVFSDSGTEEPAGKITCFLAGDILDD